MNVTDILIPKRVEKEEKLDRNDVAIKDVKESFNDLHRINRYLGGVGVYRKSLYTLIRENPSGEKLRILDVGTGSSDLTVEVLREAQKIHNNVSITGLDLQHRFLDLAKKNHGNIDRLHLVVSDAFQMPFHDNAFDFVISNLVLHHFYNRADRLLNEMYRVSSRAVVINDLLRHRVPLLFFKLFAPVITRSHITQYDGEVSLRRAFSLPELRTLLEQSHFDHYTLKKHWSFRFGLIIRKNNE